MWFPNAVESTWKGASPFIVFTIFLFPFPVIYYTKKTDNHLSVSLYSLTLNYAVVGIFVPALMK